MVAATHDPKRESNDATTRATVPRMRCAIIIMMMAARRGTTRTALSADHAAAGDVAYNGVHQYLLESRGGGIREWLAAIAKVEALQPRAVVAGHKNRDLPDDPVILAQTRQYLVDAQQLLDEKPTPRQCFGRTLALYPDRLNPGPVWYGALGLLS